MLCEGCPVCRNFASAGGTVTSRRCFVRPANESRILCPYAERSGYGCAAARLNTMGSTLEYSADLKYEVAPQPHNRTPRIAASHFVSVNVARHAWEHFLLDAVATPHARWSSLPGTFLCCVALKQIGSLCTFLGRFFGACCTGVARSSRTVVAFFGRFRFCSAFEVMIQSK